MRHCLTHCLKHTKKQLPVSVLRQCLRQCLKHCKELPINAFDITFDMVFLDLLGILLIVMSSDIVDIDRALAGDLWVV
jgi:hypothetical protein